MITNEREYRITKNSAEKFRSALDKFDDIAALESGLDPMIVKAQRESLESQYKELKGLLRQYENMKSGSIRDLSGSAIEDIGTKLVMARIVAGLSQRQLAEKLGLKQQQIQRYEADKFQSASLRRLEQIADALGVNVSFKFEFKDGLQKSADAPIWRNINIAKMPIKEIKKRGWLDDLEVEAPANEEILLKTFLARALDSKANAPLYRQNIRARSTLDAHSLLAWQCRVLYRARKLADNRRLVHGAMSSAWISSLVKLSRDEEGPLKAIEFLWDKGIVVVVEPHLPKTFIDGAAMLLDRSIPVVGLTLRQDRLDNFWFVLLHELGHVFKHRTRGLEAGFFDEDLVADNRELEVEANEFAQRALIPDEVWKTNFVRYTNSAHDVKAFASKYGISPSIVAGRIRRERKDYRLFSELVGSGRLKELFKAAGLLGD